MPKVHHPRLGSMQFWPRKRAKHSLARIRSWAKGSKTKPLGFIGYKAGMTHLQVLDNNPKSITKGEHIFMPATIIDCPPIKVAGVALYKRSMFGLQKTGSVLASSDSVLKRKIQLPKKQIKTLEQYTDFDDLRLLIYSQPQLASIGTKKPKLLEIAIGGSKDEKVKYAASVLGKEIPINDVFDTGNVVDIHGIGKGKGFQGTVKRFGAHLRQHKAEKTKRGIATLGSWTPKRIEFTVPQPGKMGYHLRTEYNKQIIKIGKDGKEVTPLGGFINYGLVNNSYLLIKGSVIGPKKRPVVLTQATRPDTKMVKEAPSISYVSLRH